MIGQTISHYRVVSQLGAGGMGVVYRAEDIRLGRSVALKFLPEDLTTDSKAVDRLRSEARAASALNHPNICTIYEIDDHEGQPFIAMELMKGQTLRERLQGGPLRIHQVVDIGIQIADALDAAHAQGIIHRDVKPANIFLTERNQVKVLDFGLAKATAEFVGSSTTRADDLTEAGVTLGTVSHMSPEQATGEELDGRSDIFSLGVVLYECATGHQPFKGKTSAVILSAILTRAPAAPIVFNPDIPPRLQEVINNCLEKERELRYQSAADLRADLKRVRRDIESGHSQAVVAAEIGDVERTTPPSGRRAVQPPGSGSAARVEVEPEGRRGGGGVILLVAAAALVTVTSVGFVLWSRQQPEPSPATPSTSAASVTLPPAAVESRFELARASFEARNYRAALAYAAEVLAVAPDHAGAAQLRDDARDRLARFDEAVAEARRQLDAGNSRRAADALETARSIDPFSPAVAELGARIGQPGARTEPARPAPPPARRAEPQAAEPPRPAPSSVPPAVPPPAAAASSAPPATSPPAAAPSAQPPAAPAPGQTAASAQPPAGAPSPGAPEDDRPSPPERAADPPPSAEPVRPPAPPAVPPPAAAPPAAAVEARDTRKPEAAAPDPAREPTREEDEAAIRRALATYARAIESEDLSLFKSVKPNLSAEEERRLVESFRAISSQRIDLTVQSIERKGSTAVVRIRRRDTIQAGGRPQSVQSQQTLTLTRSDGGWVIVEIR